MKKNNQPRTAQKRAKASMNEALVEGAASMSGKAAKEIAKGLIGGAMGEATAQKRKLRNKLKRKQFIDSLKGKKQQPQKPRKPKKKVKEEITVEPPIYIGYDEKDSQRKMKKDSGFKMKRTLKTFDFGSTKAKNKRDYTAKEEKDFSMHNISARRTEGTIRQQAKRRAARNPIKKITGHGMYPTHAGFEGYTGREFETKKERSSRIDEYTRTPSVAETLRKRKGEKKRQRPLSKIDKLLGKKQRKK